MSDQITREQAIALFDTKFWLTMSQRDIALFQMHTDKLCMPFEVFHWAIEKALGRPVYTHELGFDRDGLIKELLGEQPAPSMDEIVSLLPKDVAIIAIVGDAP